MAAVVNLASNCREFGCLPGPGSLMEQDSLLIFLINLVQGAWREREKKEAADREREAKSKQGHR